MDCLPYRGVIVSRLTLLTGGSEEIEIPNDIIINAFNKTNSWVFNPANAVLEKVSMDFGRSTRKSNPGALRIDVQKVIIQPKASEGGTPPGPQGTLTPLNHFRQSRPSAASA
jgi:hypothetical protein